MSDVGGLRHGIATVVLGPVLLLQGRRVRRRTPRLPEPPGAREGVAGEGAPLRVLITGDSAAAGVGAASQDEALSGRLVRDLARDFRVEWRLEARTGATTEDTLERLGALRGETFDVLVTSLGVNDLTRGVTIRSWLDSQRTLRALARSALGIRLFVIAGVPPVEGFPALPQPLRWFLGARARDLSRRLRADLASEPDAEFLDLRFTLDPTLMADDGFHPGPEIYDGWGRRAARIIRDRRHDAVPAR